MTFRDIFQDVARRCDKNADNPDPVTRARLNQQINDVYATVMRTPGVVQIRDEAFSFTTEADKARYTLPVSARGIVSITDTTHRVKLSQRSMAWIRERDPSVPAQVTGTPWVYTILNTAGIERQPVITTASALELVSGSALDTGQVEIEYQDDNGGFRVVLVTLTGTTPVTVPATITQVFRVTYLQSAQGAITLRQTLDALSIAVLPATAQASQTGNPHASRAYVLHLWPTPGGAYTYTVDGPRPRAMLMDDLDEPAFDEEFHTLLVWGACAAELLKMDDDRREDYRKMFADDLRAFRAFLHQARGTLVIPDGSRRGVGWTPMGSNYPEWQ